MAIYRPPADGGQQIACASEARGSVNVYNRHLFAKENECIRVLNSFRLFCGDMVNQPWIQRSIMGLTVINAAMMGVATFDFVMENPVVESAFNKTDLGFLIVFTIELVMQFIFLGHTLFMDGWLVFDFVIIIASWAAASLQVIRSFRIFRALRIITRIKTLRKLVQALLKILPRLGSITAMLLLIFYIFGVLFTELFGELELSGEYFSRLDYSLLTMFVMMTMEWSDIARECMAQIWWAWMPFVSFIMITGFIVFNLVIAVVCDAVAVIENKSDLQPDLFSGVFGSKEKAEDILSEIDVSGRQWQGLGESNRTHTHGLIIEEEVVEDLRDRITSALNNQKVMLATLERLINGSMVPIQPVAKETSPRFVKDDVSEESWCEVSEN